VDYRSIQASPIPSLPRHTHPIARVPTIARVPSLRPSRSPTPGGFYPTLAYSACPVLALMRSAGCCRPALAHVNSPGTACPPAGRAGDSGGCGPEMAAQKYRFFS
jgi:hypothetical protein